MVNDGVIQREHVSNGSWLTLVINGSWLLIVVIDGRLLTNVHVAAG